MRRGPFLFSQTTDRFITGTYYKIQCGFHADGKELAKYNDVPSFSDCMKKCSEMASHHYLNSSAPLPIAYREVKPKNARLTLP
jgi:hypothetical protein